METCHNDGKNITEDKNEPPFSKKEDMIALLNAFFKYGYLNLPSTLVPDMSKEECDSAIQSAFEKAKIASNKKPSIIEWINSGIFNDEYNIPLALLLIGLYEYPLSEERNEENDFKEIYLFLYKMTTNQPTPYLSDNSARILYKLLSESIDEVWPSMQKDLLKYLSNIHIYSRSEIRRTYSGKEILKKKTAKNCTPQNYK